MRALTIAPLFVSLVVAGSAYADDTFEAAAANAQRVSKIESIVWAFTAPCDSGDDTQQRQCKRVRDARATELAGATLLVDADKAAFDVGAWNAQKKSVPLKLSSCIRCPGVEVDGKKFIVVATKDGASTSTLYDNARQFPDEATAKAYAASTSGARVQLLVKLPAKPTTVVDGKPAIALDVVGYRVFSPCDGNVVVASPPSGPVAADKKQCAATGAAEVAELTQSMIDDTMQPVVKAANDCFVTFGVVGKAKLTITVGGNGAVTEYDQQGDFPRTPTGKCIDAAMSRVKFPRSKKPKTTFTYPIHLK